MSDEHFQKLLKTATELSERSSDREFDEFYRAARITFRTETVHAIHLSRSLGGRLVEPPRRGWATILFTRICVTAVSIRRLLPDVGGHRKFNHWDLGSISSLCRALIEAQLFMFYFGIDDVPEDEWLMRKWLVDLHDAVSRNRFLTGLGLYEGVEGEDIVKDLQDRLSGHPLFTKLPEKRQKHFLSGRHACFMSQDEILERMDLDFGQFRPMYEYLSAQTHSLPLAFHRMSGGVHGRGIENNRDKHQISLFLTYTCSFLIVAGLQLRSMFPEDFPPEER